MDYSTYLQTEDWDHKRKQTYKKAKFRCQLCKRNDQKLNAHHIRYGDLFSISIGKDLMCLCQPCHLQLHYLIKISKVLSWPDYRELRWKPTKKQYKKYLKKLWSA